MTVITSKLGAKQIIRIRSHYGGFDFTAGASQMLLSKRKTNDNRQNIKTKASLSIRLTSYTQVGIMTSY